MLEVPALEDGSLMGILESLLLVATDATTPKELAAAAGAEVGEVEAALAALAASYRTANRGIQLREVAGGWRLFTHPAYHEQVEALVLSWDRRKLSQAALETLAVIAYLQPVTREGVRAVRGVNSDGVIASLKDKGLVREAGKDQRRSALFATTTAFLETFGLRGISDLPPLEDFAPDEESRKFIRERLSGQQMTVALEEVAADLDEERELIDDVGDAGVDAAHPLDAREAGADTAADASEGGMGDGEA